MVRIINFLAKVLIQSGIFDILFPLFSGPHQEVPLPWPWN